MVVDGSFDISDSTGQTVHATKGDVLYFPKGSKIRFEANGEDNGGKGGLGFYVGQVGSPSPSPSYFPCDGDGGVMLPLYIILMLWAKQRAEGTA